MALFCAIGSRRAVTVAVVIAIPALSQRHFDCMKRLPGQGGKKMSYKRGESEWKAKRPTCLSRWSTYTLMKSHLKRLSLRATRSSLVYLLINQFTPINSSHNNTV